VYYFAPTTWVGSNSRLLIKNKNQLTKLLTSSSHKNFISTGDYRLFAAYNFAQGQDYRFIKFREQNSYKKKYSVHINELELDIPRFKFVGQRY